MKIRWLALFLFLAMALVACSDDDPELSTESTVVTGGTNAPATTTTTAGEDGGDAEGTASSTTLVGQIVSEFEVVARFPNDNGEERYYVIPNGAYTDVDLQNFVYELLDADPDLYGAEIFDDADAAEAFQVDPADRSDEESELLERHHFVTVVGRDRIEFNGPFAEFPGGAIGS